jgi:hypothetical protein
MQQANRQSAPQPPGGTQDVYYSRHAIVPLPMIERASGIYTDISQIAFVS